jgi:Zn-dependent peptidase ImmA (M78 family)
VRHGFKAHAERLSVKAREELGLTLSAPLDPWIYANHLGVLVLDFRELDLSPECCQRLLDVDRDSWSGMTIREAETTAILVNPSHARSRQSSTLMHELAHFMLKHVPVRVDVSPSGMLLLSEYSDEGEAEADWLASALLLPRDILMRYRRRGDSVFQIASAFGTSEQLCEWRLRMTGVDIQLRRMVAR